MTKPAEKEPSIFEREIAVKERELDLKVLESQRSRWRSPLVVAVLAAALGAFGSAYVAYYNAREARLSTEVEFIQKLTLAQSEAENARILEMIKIGDPDQVRENLLFLIDAQLIEDSETVSSILKYYEDTEPGAGPGVSTGALSALSGVGGVFGLDDAVKVSDLPRDHRAKNFAQSVGILSVSRGSSGARTICSGFVVSSREVLTSLDCVRDASEAQFLLTWQGGQTLEERQFVLDLSSAKQFSGSDGLGYVVVELSGGALTELPLMLTNAEINVGSKLGVIYFRNGKEKLVVWGSEDCRVLSVEEETFNHLCDTGPGTSGSPIIDLKSGAVIGVHILRGLQGGVAHKFLHLD